MGLKWFKGQVWSKNNRRTIKTRVTLAYTRVDLYAAAYGNEISTRMVHLLSYFASLCIDSCKSDIMSYNWSSPPEWFIYCRILLESVY